MYFHSLELGFSPAHVTEWSWEKEEALQPPALGTDLPVFSTEVFGASFHLCYLYVSAKKPFSTYPSSVLRKLSKSWVCCFENQQKLKYGGFFSWKTQISSTSRHTIRQIHLCPISYGCQRFCLPHATQRSRYFRSHFFWCKTEMKCAAQGHTVRWQRSLAEKKLEI